MAVDRVGTFFGAVLVVSGLVGTLLGGFAATAAAKRYPAGYAWTLGLSALASVPVAAAAFLAPSPPVSMACLAAAMFLVFLSTGPVNTLILETVPVNLRASAMALSIFTIHLFGDMWSSEIVGRLSDQWQDLQKAVLILPGALFVGALLWLALAWKTETAPSGCNEPDAHDMRYRLLGVTGLNVSVIGVGTWQLGGEWGRSFGQSEADAILDTASELGINLIDTAECYGDHLSETFVGDYLSRHDRSSWVVATKFGHCFHTFMDRTENFSPVDVRRQLETSLRALRLETMDLYQFHSGPDSAFLNEDLWSMLAEQKRAGKVRHLGVSILGKGSELQAREGPRLGVEALQVIYNRLDRRADQIDFPHAERDHLGILARGSRWRAASSGKYRRAQAFLPTTSGDFRCRENA